MSKTLNKFLKESGYSFIKLIFLETKHYLIEAKVNGIKGRFILDTGASNTCICTSLENKFKVVSMIAVNVVDGSIKLVLYDSVASSYPKKAVTLLGMVRLHIIRLDGKFSSNFLFLNFIFELIEN